MPRFFVVFDASGAHVCDPYVPRTMGKDYIGLIDSSVLMPSDALICSGAVIVLTSPPAPYRGYTWVDTSWAVQPTKVVPVDLPTALEVGAIL